jgi:hypothetical protein
MAGAPLSSTAAHLVFTPRHVLLQLPRIRQSFRPSFSRASCFWSCSKTVQHPRNQLLTKRWPETRVHGAGLLSTSAVQRSQPEETRKQPIKTQLDNGNEKVRFAIVLFPFHTCSSSAASNPLEALLISLNCDWVIQRACIISP